MTIASPYIPGHYLLQLMDTDLLPAATTRRLEAHLEKTGLDPLQLSEARLSPQSLEALLNAWPEIQPQRLAIEFGQQVSLTSQGNLSLLVMTAPTLRDALGLHALLPLLTNAISLEFFETPRAGHLQIQPHSGSPLLDELLLLYACAGLIRLSTLLTGSPCHFHVEIAKEYSTTLPTLNGALSLNWNGDAVISRLTVPTQELDRRCLHADTITHTRLVRQCETRLLRQQQAVPLVVRIRQLLARRQVEPDQESVARALNMSRSTLKRHLSHEHTHFQAVLTDFRRETAVRLLLGTTQSLEQIAEQLGYSDQTNFSHAFRHWSGMTPGQFRKHSQ
ncbi:MAG: helix-turn-helix domain-containing protein [Pseudomonadota bacterium]|nr:helix-turn-helix domain-containing protein [Pseudomonadota bacterium]